MKYTCTLIAVKNMEKAKQFYHDVLGLEVISDFGANVTLTGGIALQTLDTWKEFIYKSASEIILENNACELYFEEDDMSGFISKYIHPLIEHSWGQRVVRFYDLDRHIIEVGENMGIVVKRFLDRGLTIEETAVRMDVPISYIQSFKL